MGAGQTTSTTTAGTGLPVLHIKFNEQGLASLTQQTKELLFLKGETAVKLSLWYRTDPSSHEQEELLLLMVLPLASQHVPKITAMTPLGTTIMLNTPQSRQGSKIGKRDLEGGLLFPYLCSSFPQHPKQSHCHRDT